MNEIFDFKKHPIARAYTLLVYWRHKKINEEIFKSKKYYKRKVEDIQESENIRMELHKKAVETLIELGYKEKKACEILENECERLAKEKLRDLKDGEIYCGCCRIILKTKDWEKHQEDEKVLHNYLSERLMDLSKQQSLIIIQMMKDKKNKGVKE